MFDLDIENNFSTMLNNFGIETYTFNLVGTGPDVKTEFFGIRHDDNVNLAKEIVEKYKIDFVMGYSYGCKIVIDLVQRVNLKGVMFLDPATKIDTDTELIDGGDKVRITKASIQKSMEQYQVTIDKDTADKYLQAVCDGDFIDVASYPRLPRPGPIKVVPGVSVRLFFTKNSNAEYRSQWPEIMFKYYPQASHWILLEEYRQNLAVDVNDFILYVNNNH